MTALFADRYRLERRLGTGGMSTVELAFDTRLERHVAVKLLAEHLAQDASFIARFKREALAAARLVHPNIVQVFDFGSDEATGRQFIVMEYVDGHSCAEILRDDGPLDPDDAVDVLAQACRGLDYAHRNGVIHRDVKPGNLLRSLDGNVKLADFGIAKAAEQSDITKVGSVVGTAAYLSPEQARGEPAGPASDLYALGVVAYQLLAGRLPYEAASLTDLARQQDTGPPLALHQVNRDVPPELSAAIMRALLADPEARYGGDARALERALRDGLRGVAPAPATAATRALRRDEEAATRMLEGTAATSALPRTQARPSRRLEPLDEPPPARRQAAGPSRRPAAAPRKRRGSRLLAVLLVLLALGGAAFAVYEASGDGGQKKVQLNTDIQGDVDQTVDSIKQLIADNTR